MENILTHCATRDHFSMIFASQMTKGIAIVLWSTIYFAHGGQCDNLKSHQCVDIML